MKLLIQTTIKEIDEKEPLDFLADNLKKYGWPPDQIERFKKEFKAERSGKLSDGLSLTETIEVKEKFSLIGG